MTDLVTLNMTFILKIANLNSFVTQSSILHKYILLDITLTIAFSEPR